MILVFILKYVNTKETIDGLAEHDVEKPTQDPALQQEDTETVLGNELQPESTGSGMVIYKCWMSIQKMLESTKKTIFFTIECILGLYKQIIAILPFTFLLQYDIGAKPTMAEMHQS